ncbi:MAG TPA: ribbon-helix-helix protein, CopG family [Thermomicrobiales bacterium]|jgi:predicted DNA-binding protein|nr:ribbon-helix-helix protein, CopG family [Thermomicrobiales bacterium]
MSEYSRLPNGNRPLPTASFALRPEQVEQLRKLASQRNTSQSAIVRDAVDLYMRDTVRQALEHLQSVHRGDGNPLFP